MLKKNEINIKLEIQKKIDNNFMLKQIHLTLKER